MEENQAMEDNTADAFISGPPTVSQVLHGVQVGECLNVAGRDVTIIHTYIGCNVSVPGHRDQPPHDGSSGPGSSTSASGRSGLGKRKRRQVSPAMKHARARYTYNHTAASATIRYSAVQLPENSVLGMTPELCHLSLFPVLENSLQLITHLVDPPIGSTSIFHRISPDLRDLVRLVTMSSRAYRVCSGHAAIGRIIRLAIESRVSACNQRLTILHQEMLSLPHRSVPLVRSIGRALCEWWTSNEPEAITDIRSQLHAETVAFGEWLASLKSLYWASHQLLVAKSEFSWNDLETFFESGPTLLKGMHVEKIIIIEPLQGEQLNVPIRFIKSFEDVHHVVELACRGTVGARYIEDRLYQLDDSETNALVDPHRFVDDHLQDGKAFEVAVRLVRRDSVSFDDCPRCGYQYSEEEPRKNGWIRCRGCKVRFHNRFSKSSTPELVDLHHSATLNTSMATPHLPSRSEVQEVVQNLDNRGSVSMMFRRLAVKTYYRDMGYPQIHFHNTYQQRFGRAPPPIEAYPVDRMWKADACSYRDSETGPVRFILGSGTGLSKREAKDAAALQAYEALRALYFNRLPDLT